ANQKGAGTVTVNAAIGGNLTVANLDGGDTTTITAATEVGGAVRLTNTAGAAGNTGTLNGHVGRGGSIANPRPPPPPLTPDSRHPRLRCDPGPGSGRRQPGRHRRVRKRHGLCQHRRRRGVVRRQRRAEPGRGAQPRRDRGGGQWGPDYFRPEPDCDGRGGGG